MYSQNAEESFILTYFGDFIGSFLDVGAAIQFSNTRALAELGWSGVCVEPDEQAMAGIREAYRNNRRIKIVPKAIAETSGEKAFHSSRGGLVSTLSQSHRDKWSSAATFETTTVQAITPAELLEQNPGPFQMFNLDVEGMNADLFELFPLADMGTELVCVEHDLQDARILAHCGKHGLRRVAFRSAENLVVGR